MEGQFENIKFQTNIPLTFALKFAEGKAVQSQYGGEDQVLFTTTDGRRMYLSPYAAKKIEAVGARPGEAITVCKREVVRGNRRGIEWEAKLAEQEPVLEEAQSRVAAAPAQNKPAPAENTNINNSNQVTATTKLGYALKTAIYEAHAAEKYAESIGYSCRFDSDHVKSMALTILINNGREQR
jgi:hypothetical protein